MSDGNQFTLARQVVLDGVCGLGISDPAIYRTAFLIRDGYCVGQRLFFDGIQAIWLTAENVVRFYADDGDILKTVEIGQEPSEKIAA
jgi:hypothetical protein